MRLHRGGGFCVYSKLLNILKHKPELIYLLNDVEMSTVSFLVVKQTGGYDFCGI